jgi:hypothetical protein
MLLMLLIPIFDLPPDNLSLDFFYLNSSLLYQCSLSVVNVSTHILTTTYPSRLLELQRRSKHARSLILQMLSASPSFNKLHFILYLHKPKSRPKTKHLSFLYLIRNAKLTWRILLHSSTLAPALIIEF